MSATFASTTQAKEVLDMFAADLPEEGHTVGRVSGQSPAAAANIGQRLGPPAPQFLAFDGLLKHEQHIGAERTALRQRAAALIVGRVYQAMLQSGMCYPPRRESASPVERAKALAV